MLVDESVQTELDFQRKAFQEKVVKEGMELCKRQKEFAKMKKLKEQQEMREMLERHWPWGRARGSQPRGLRNLRLEEIFPNEDYEHAKRFVGNLDLGRGGGGAPLYSGGKKVTRTHEDPLLRFQFGNKDLRRCVDNILRYKTDKASQQEYKKQLDKLVEEKKLKEKKEKQETKRFHQGQFSKSPPWGKRGPGGRPWRNPNTIGLNFLKSLGWSTEETLKDLHTEDSKNDSQDSGHSEKNKKTKCPSNRVKLDPISPRKSFIPVGKNRKLSPLSNSKDVGVELVTILARNRKYPPRIPLCSSDITSDVKMGRSSIWSRQGSAYLKELAQQIICKERKLREMKVKENEYVQRHFSTCDGFWGRPGHGAPLPEIKKKSLDRLLYPQMVSISVH